jgi:hypothetical protein
VLGAHALEDFQLAHVVAQLARRALQRAQLGLRLDALRLRG